MIQYQKGKYIAESGMDMRLAVSMRMREQEEGEDNRRGGGWGVGSKAIFSSENSSILLRPGFPYW